MLDLRLDMFTTVVTPIIIHFTGGSVDTKEQRKISNPSRRPESNRVIQPVAKSLDFWATWSTAKYLATNKQNSFQTRFLHYYLERQVLTEPGLKMERRGPERRSDTWIGEIFPIRLIVILYELGIPLNFSNDSNFITIVGYSVHVN